MQLSGKNPIGIIGAIIYYVCNVNNYTLSQVKIAKKLRITDITIRSRLKELRLFDEKDKSKPEIEVKNTFFRKIKNRLK